MTQNAQAAYATQALYWGPPAKFYSSAEISDFNYRWQKRREQKGFHDEFRVRYARNEDRLPGIKGGMLRRRGMVVHTLPHSETVASQLLNGMPPDDLNESSFHILLNHHAQDVRRLLDAEEVAQRWCRGKVVRRSEVQFV